MTEWYTYRASIQAKMLFAFGTMAALVAACALTTLMADRLMAIIVLLVLSVISALAGRAFCSVTAGPYATNVVRTEGLAAEDPSGPVLFFDNADGVGRTTMAMFNFRDDAQAQIALHDINSPCRRRVVSRAWVRTRQSMHLR